VITSGECLLSLRALSFVFPSFVYNMKVKNIRNCVFTYCLAWYCRKEMLRLKVLNEYIDLTLYTLNFINTTDNVQKISLLLATPTCFSFSKPSSRRLSQEENLNCRPNILCTGTKELYYDSLLEASVEKQKRVVECNKKILYAWLILVDSLD
jgi:hypothetical protein